MPALPYPGDVVHLTRYASVQFRIHECYLRVARVGNPADTYPGFVWLTGYELNPHTGNAIEQRDVFVLINGLKWVRLTRLAVPTRTPTGEPITIIPIPLRAALGERPPTAGPATVAPTSTTRSPRRPNQGSYPRR